MKVARVIGGITHCGREVNGVRRRACWQAYQAGKLPTKPAKTQSPSAAGRAATAVSVGLPEIMQMPFSVIYVDDDDGIRDAITTLLRMSGVLVTDCSNGEGAIRALAAGTPDAVLIDLNMPHMDGFEVARNIRQSDRGIRLVAISGEATRKNRNNATDAGFNRFLEKPTSTEQLLTALGKCA